LNAHGGGVADPDAPGVRYNPGVGGLGGTIRFDIGRPLAVGEVRSVEASEFHPHLTSEVTQQWREAEPEVISGPLITDPNVASLDATRTVTVWGAPGRPIWIAVGSAPAARFLGGQPANPFVTLEPGANEVCVFTVEDLDRSVPETHHCRTVLYLPPEID
jgi:hypothetical protein